MYHHSPYKPASKAQVACLIELGVTPPSNVSAAQADRLIKENQEKWEKLPPTQKQRLTLQFSNLWREGMTRGLAAEIIGNLQKGPDWVESLEEVDTFRPKPAGCIPPDWPARPKGSKKPPAGKKPSPKPPGRPPKPPGRPPKRKKP